MYNKEKEKNMNSLWAVELVNSDNEYFGLLGVFTSVEDASSKAAEYIGPYIPEIIEFVRAG